MSRRASSPAEHAARHTAIIREPVNMFSKLAWDADVFRDIQISYPDETEPLAFAAINVCISAWSLRNWVESARKKQVRAQGLQFDRAAFWAEIAVEIPEQCACDAIANTAKHANFGDESWPGGSVVLEWEDGDEDSPPGYVLLHRTRDRSLNFAVNRFAALCDNWWGFLNRYAMADGHNRLPEWQQHKLNRIFGRHIEMKAQPPMQ
jgi:hypothetical protein